MNEPRRHYFSLHELLIMAALAALGGASSALLSMLREMSHAVPGFGGARQLLAGIHVLWLVLAVGLIRKPGAGTVTGLLKGAVELLLANPHGLLVFLYCVSAGVIVDLVWLLLGRSDRSITYVLAGATGTAVGPWLFKVLGLLPPGDLVLRVLLLLSGVAFVSGALLAGVLAWWLLQALRKAGVAGAQPHGPPIADSTRT